MAGTGARTRLQPAQRRECERAASKAAAEQEEETSRRPPARTPRLQWRASDVSARTRTPAAGGRQEYRCDRFPLLLSPAAGATHKPESSVPAAQYDARY